MIAVMALTTKRISRRNLLRLAFYSLPVLAAAEGFCWEPHRLKVRRRTLASGKPTHRLVHLSDLHHKGDRAYLQRVVDEVKRWSPDFVCFTGDLMEDPKHLPEALKLLQGIGSPIYGVPGNHDYGSGANFSDIAKAFAGTGGAWLTDRQTVTADGKFSLIGSSWLQPPPFKRERHCKHILLFHYPALVDNLTGQPFDLMLAGHSHGGQVRLPFIGPLILPHSVGRYDLGMYQTPSGPFHVSAGIGWFHLPVRFNCRPEITVFEI